MKTRTNSEPTFSIEGAGMLLQFLKKLKRKGGIKKIAIQTENCNPPNFEEINFNNHHDDDWEVFESLQPKSLKDKIKQRSKDFKNIFDFYEDEFTWLLEKYDSGIFETFNNYYVVNNDLENNYDEFRPVVEIGLDILLSIFEENSEHVPERLNIYTRCESSPSAMVQIFGNGFVK
jgi:hypothetical protein